MDKKYSHILIEKDKNQIWKDNKLFEVKEDNLNNKNFSIILPPPNVTGKLHLGHAWDGALQDILIRYKKLNGFNAVWFPGMDHAGIATQAKVETRLAQQGIYRKDLSRHEFVNKIWEWKDEYASTIEKQWGKLGIGLDYSKQKFTLDDDIKKKVKEAFVKLYNEGLIYQGTRIINWDTKLQTAISDIEVEFEEVEGKFYYLKYYIVGTKEYVEVATTRPETIFGDVALAINPEDDRCQELLNKKVKVPGVDREIPIIADDYVEKDFGSGIVKITPAHDPNDYEVGERHDLEEIVVMNLDGSLNKNAGKYEGLDRFEVRNQLIHDLEEANLVIKIENHTHNVGHSERSKTIIEPLLSKQWFLKAGQLSKEALEFQKNNKSVEFLPPRFEETYKKWSENTLDWCISRQLWWGHQIPVWYHKETKEKYVDVNPPIDIENYDQDEDVLDTWFSSALWPFAVQDQKLKERFYPTSVLVTGYDIIFFWVSRMIYQGIKFEKNIPFEKVLIHGLIRDENGQKMSKSLGNGIDPMDVIEEYGADSLRYFLSTNSTPGQDLRFSKEKIEASWNYINKIWNISRFIISKQQEYYPDFDYEVDLKLEIENYQNLTSADKYIINRFNTTLEYVKKMMDKFEFTEVSSKIYSFVWDDFASWYIETAKIIMEKGTLDQRKQTNTILIYLIESILKMLHPFIPFVTEEIYGILHPKQFLIKSSYPEIIQMENLNNNFNDIKEVITCLRNFKTEKNIKPSKMVSLNLERINDSYFDLMDIAILNILGKIENITYEKQSNNKDTVTKVLKNITVNISLDGLINHEEQKLELENQIRKLEQELNRSLNILSNDNFVKRASEDKVKAEKDKALKYIEQYNEFINKNDYNIEFKFDISKLINLSE